MKFIILGCGSSMGVPRPDGFFGVCDPKEKKNYRTRCSALLTDNKFNILIDTSPDLRYQLISNKIKNINKVLYTHNHADQTHGINDLRVFYLLQKKTVNIYSNSHTANYLKKSFAYCFEKNQENSFINHIEAAIELDLPIIIHSRDAETKTYEILKDYKNQKPKLLMHCFTGSLDFAKKLMDLGSYFSASGIITFKNAKDLQETFKQISMDKILIETDSPFLAPIPNRGKKNEPSFIKYTAIRLSERKGVAFEKLVLETTKNFNNLFNLS